MLTLYYTNIMSSKNLLIENLKSLKTIERVIVKRESKQLIVEKND